MTGPQFWSKPTSVTSKSTAVDSRDLSAWILHHNLSSQLAPLMSLNGKWNEGNPWHFESEWTWCTRTSRGPQRNALFNSNTIQLSFCTRFDRHSPQSKSLQAFLWGYRMRSLFKKTLYLWEIKEFWTRVQTLRQVDMTRANSNTLSCLKGRCQ